MAGIARLDEDRPMSAIDPQLTPRPPRPADVYVQGDGAPPEDLQGWDDADVVHRELFFEPIPDPGHPLGWWVMMLWKEPGDVQPL